MQAAVAVRGRAAAHPRGKTTAVAVRGKAAVHPRGKQTAVAVIGRTVEEVRPEAVGPERHTAVAVNRSGKKR